MRWMCVLTVMTSSALGQTVVDGSIGNIKEHDFKSMKDGLVYVVENPALVQYSDLYYSTREWICGNVHANGNTGVYNGFQLFAFDPLLQTYYFSKSMSTDQAVPPEEKANIERAVGDLCRRSPKQ